MTNGDAEDVSTLPDNFSDVVPISANVSGRGSPSISGRETPLSAHAEQPGMGWGNVQMRQLQTRLRRNIR
jgi:hypothetical protein